MIIEIPMIVLIPTEEIQHWHTNGVMKGKELILLDL